MASNQAGTRKKQSNRKQTISRQQKRRKKQSSVNEPIRDEVCLIIIFLISLLMLLSIIGLCGPFGKVINSLLFGMTGFVTYLIPFLLFFLAAFILANRGNVLARHKRISFYVLLFAVTGLFQMASGYHKELHFWEYYTESAAHKNGGGLLGGLFVSILCPVFGKLATVIILIAVILVCMIFITGKAIVTRISKASGEKIKEHRERKALYAEQYEAMEDKEREYLSRPRTARTVTLEKTGLSDGETKSVPISLQTDKKKPGFLEQLKKKGSYSVEKGEETKKKPVDEFVGLSEIKINGQEANFEPSGEMISDINSIYEEEMAKKFGEEKESEDRSEPERKAESNPETVKPQTIEQEPVKKTPETKKDNEAAEPMVIDASCEPEKKYVYPPLSLLAKPKPNQKGMTEKDLKETALKLQRTLDSFGVHVTVTNISCGPAVTRYELAPEQGVKVSRITGLADDIKLNLAAADVRIEAPIPGKAAVGIEVPNKENSAVMLRELLDSKEFKTHKSDIAFAVGKDIGGQCIVTDIAKMPHLLIAGATGSGKSVCINTLIMSILYKAEPADVRLIMVDPKVVELSVYNGIPHLLIPVVTDPKKASAALNWAVAEMTDRYKKFAELSVRDLKGYNEKVLNDPEIDSSVYKKLPQIVIIVDELADLMMVAPGEVEDAICRLAQMARAAGLHLIIATQRPSVNVITGVIKANVPSRIAFSVSSAIDSRTIIDSAGAEKLLGKGDMLFFPSGYPKPIRVQGAFVSDKEVSAVVDFLKEQNQEHTYSEEVSQQIQSAQINSSGGASAASDRDEYFVEAGRFIIEKDKASIGMLQRVYKIGFNRAARIMEQLSDAGVVGPEEGTKPRKILMSMEEFEQYVDEYV